MAAFATHDAAFFGRVLLSLDPESVAEVARSIDEITFSKEDQERMQRLADKASAGTLTPEEEQEIDSYERVGHYLGILKSKARLTAKSLGRNLP